MGRFPLIVVAAAFVVALTGAAIAESARGPVTNLPLPRYVSLKASKANVRRGPSLTHRIDWVFKRKNMPLEITAEYGHWRRVRDIEGLGGWIHYSLLSGARTVIVEQDMMPLNVRPESDTPMVAHLELGVVARLGECGPDWCRLNAGGFKGWAPKTNLWGVQDSELRD
ncbi:SH3 domain-containing protein [Shimia abyssi]|uniref:SH3-like domain-containing protein n=1 Tax=Shimia abyssi TaxID=1662395 RepID=A0A2P8FHM1_9RHOB|nr:SH3 domain-containing protein [Shimia abyssi]PSL21186.1 SH3-like domain-containing protein [Shimia abyssi]